jgi:uncharacterized protein YecE (DUF72 family)
MTTPRKRTPARGAAVVVPDERPADLDERHAPGVRAARERAEAVRLEHAVVVRPPGAGAILCGTAGWTDPTLTAPGVFYPDDATTPEARLRYYASRFPLVEVDSPYYALPTAQMAERWIERTPDEFTFNVKAHALMTGHPTEVARLPKTLRDAMPDELAGRSRVYPKDLPAEVYDAVWGGFVDALAPLREAGRLGAVLLQYPPWFLPGSRGRETILEARERLEGLPIAVEFRNRRWLAEDVRERTLQFLEQHEIPYVIVDEPQGLASSVPPIVAVTSPSLAIIRMHGHRGATWEQRGVPVVEKFRYLYDRAELSQWVPKALDAAFKAERVHVVFNNCHGNYGTTNALEMSELLAGAAGD